MNKIADKTLKTKLSLGSFWRKHCREIGLCASSGYACDSNQVP
jgi:hypothetical protein